MDNSKQLKLSYWEMVIIVLMLFTVTAESADKNCSASRCSQSGLDIHFPFWLKQNNSSAQPADDCSSLPGFQLSCAVSDHERGVDPWATKDDTLVEYQNIVNTSIKGLQLSFKFSAVVEYIDYENQYISLGHRPILIDIVPISVLTNSSSTTYHLTLAAPTFYDSVMCNQPFYCYENDYENFNHDPFAFCRGRYCYDQDYTFFNCSSSAIIEYDRERKIDSLSTRNFTVFAYPSDYKMISMLDNIRSCTKLYDISMPHFLCTCTSRGRYLRSGRDILSWSTPIGGGKCEALRESCKNYDDSRNTDARSNTDAQSNTPHFEQSQKGSDHATTKRIVAGER